MGEEAPSSGKYAMQPHVAIFVYPVLGRLIPAMVLASKLSERGAKVSFLCPEHRLSRLNDARSRCHCPGVQIVGLKVDYERVNSIPEHVFKDFYLIPELCDSFREFVSSLPDPGLSCVLIDEVTCGLPEASKSLNLRRFVFVPESALAFSATMHVSRLSAESLLPLPASLETVHIPHVGTLKRSEFLSLYLPDQVDAPVLSSLTDGAVSCHRADGALLNTFEQLEPAVLSSLRDGRKVNPSSIKMFPIGPLIPPIMRFPARDEELLCTEFLSRYPSKTIVFASFGSLRNFSLEQIKVVLEGLEASGYPFIWAVRTDTDYVPSSSGSGLVLTTWAPQLQILSHPSTGLFMTHCGWNSTTESIYSGVPMLVALPEFMDQKINCKIVVEILKVGIKLESLDRDCVSKSIKYVMESKEIASNVAELKNAAQEGVRNGEKHINDFLDSLCTKST